MFWVFRFFWFLNVHFLFSLFESQKAFWFLNVLFLFSLLSFLLHFLVLMFRVLNHICLKHHILLFSPSLLQPQTKAFLFPIKTLNPPQPHVDKFPNLSYINLVSEPKSFQKFFEKVSPPIAWWNFSFKMVVINVELNSRFWDFFFQDFVESKKICYNWRKGVFSKSEVRRFVYHARNFGKLTVAILVKLTSC